MRTITNSDRIKFCIALGLTSAVDEDDTLSFYGNDQNDPPFPDEPFGDVSGSGFWEANSNIRIDTHVKVVDFGDWRATLVMGESEVVDEPSTEPDDCVHYKTIGEWNDLGYSLIDGETNLLVDEYNTPVYTDDQVVAGYTHECQSAEPVAPATPNADYDTFDGWKARGYMVIKGQKSRMRGLDNTPLFCVDQVKLVVINDGFHDGLKYQTFEEWRSDGYIINRGAKSMKRNPDGVPLFSEEQVSSDDDGIDDRHHHY